MKTYTIEQLKKMNLTKGQLIKKMGVKTYDTALPQNWLNNFVDWTGLDYHLVLSTTVWNYTQEGFGQPLSGCTEVQEKIYQYIRLLYNANKS